MTSLKRESPKGSPSPELRLDRNDLSEKEVSKLQEFERERRRLAEAEKELAEKAQALKEAAGGAGFALVISGHSLVWALSHSMEELFFEVATQCEYWTRGYRKK